MDTSISITKEDIEKIFEPFGQIDSGSLTCTFEGTGLGLSLIKQLVKAHDGTLEIKSEKGKGTTATVLFPLERVMNEDSNSTLQQSTPTNLIH